MELVPSGMKKPVVLQKILEVLRAELETYVRAAKFSHAEATAEENRAENKYDTRGLEASYLAAGQANKVAELETAIGEFEALDADSRDGSIGVGSFVELEQDGEVESYFLGPAMGGTEVEVDGREVLVITAQSPLGSQLMGLAAGDKATIELAGRKRSVKVLSVS